MPTIIRHALGVMCTLLLATAMHSSAAQTAQTATAQAATPAPQVALSPTELTAIFQRLSSIEQLRANFSQDKYLSALKRNYQSSGKVAFQRQQGVVWQLQTPVQAEIVVSPKKIIQKTANTFNEIAVDKSPYAGIGGLFLEIMGGNQQQLEANFKLISATKLSDERWAIAMQPSSKSFQQLFQQLELQGGQYIEQITIDETAGSQTRIRFSEQQASALSDAEHALLQLAQ